MDSFPFGFQGALALVVSRVGASLSPREIFGGSSSWAGAARGGVHKLGKGAGSSTHERGASVAETSACTLAAGAQIGGLVACLGVAAQRAFPPNELGEDVGASVGWRLRSVLGYPVAQLPHRSHVAFVVRVPRVVVERHIVQLRLQRSEGRTLVMRIVSAHHRRGYSLASGREQGTEVGV